jgi:hypothetical protein
MFYFPAALMTNGRDWLHPTFAAGDAGNIANVLYVLEGSRYQQNSPLTAVA